MIEKTSEEELKARIDIVDIISNYIELKISGANYKAKCPVSWERKTPKAFIRCRPHSKTRIILDWFLGLVGKRGGRIGN